MIYLHRTSTSKRD